MSHKLANGMKMWKGNENITTLLLFSLNDMKFYVRKEEEVNTIEMEHFKNIIFHKSGPTNNRHA